MFVRHKKLFINSVETAFRKFPEKPNQRFPKRQHQPVQHFRGEIIQSLATNKHERTRKENMKPRIHTDENR